MTTFITPNSKLQTPNLENLLSIDLIGNTYLLKKLQTSTGSIQPATKTEVGPNGDQLGYLKERANNVAGSIK